MTWTQTTLNIKDAAGTNQPVIAYTDGTNFSFAHPLLDNTGAVIAPATAGNQSTANTSLATIATAVQAATPAGTNSIGTVVLAVPRIITGNTTTRPNDTSVYALGDLLANSTTAGSVTPSTIAVASGNDVAGVMLRCRLKKSGSTLTNAIFRLHFYNASPTVTNGDNGAWLSTTSGYQGSFDVTIDKAFSDSAYGIGVPTSGGAMNFVPVSGTQNLYYLIEVRAAYTPIANEVFTPIIELAQ